jgi:hypothetical protein
MDPKENIQRKNDIVLERPRTTTRYMYRKTIFTKKFKKLLDFESEVIRRTYDRQMLRWRDASGCLSGP